MKQGINMEFKNRFFGWLFFSFKTNFLTKKLSEFLFYLERTDLFKILSYRASVLLQTLRLHLILVKYLSGMLSLAWFTWWNKVKFRTEPVGQIIVLHYNADTHKPEDFVSNLERKVAIPFKTLHGYIPVILILPFGATIQAGSWNGFVKSLDRDQRRENQEALYKYRENSII
ncbi:MULTISPECIES: hypothetical protein [Leptospira]|uniref:Uncharacterized protein n=2 Tax=Leptospira weilii TaxID=28184 RepID=M6Q1M9_9LEPT|nr:MULTISPECIES: hypothetical protein [Leptospira]EMJ59880.1 hypothetical protein LEP1GSC051_0095 [Leptospira sp. P2653]EMN89436.1 hypothetical protein LEP1GSC108_0386 [Leptospira weilii str. UI 13098]